MTLHFTSDDVRMLASEELTMAAARSAIQAESDGEVAILPRIDMPTPNGFLRVMAGRFRSFGGMKTMSMTRGVGNRYLLTVYDLTDGDVLAIFDADEVTRLRTAATTAVAAEILIGSGAPSRVGIVGSGFEAAAHLRILARRYPVTEASVYSRSPERRAAFASRMSDELAIRVRAVDSPEEAVAGMPLVCLATKDTSPVVDGRTFAAGAVILSIGSTRPDLRELDDAAFKRSSTVLVDSVQNAIAESGDVQSALASKVIGQSDLTAMAEAITELPPARSGELRVFKSVGTALQDLALAAAIIQAANGRGRQLGELAMLKCAERVAPTPAVSTRVTNGGR